MAKNVKNLGPDLPSLRKCTLELKYFRPAEKLDIIKIKTILLDETVEFFGEINLEYILENSIFPTVLFDEDNDIIGFICLNNYPNIPALLPEIWLHWFQKYYNIRDVTYANTLFVHCAAFNYAGHPNMFRTIIEEIFLNYQKLKYLCVVEPPFKEYNNIYNDLFKNYGTRYVPKDCEGLKRSQAIFLCKRNDYLPLLRFREALCEDNDYLVDILDVKYPELKKNLGDFYISEKVLAGTLIVVMELNNKQVGVLWLNKYPNLTEMYKNFNIVPFDNLLQTHRSKEDYILRDIIQQHSECFYESILKFREHEENLLQDNQSTEGSEIAGYEMKQMSIEEIFLSEIMIGLQNESNKWKYSFQNAKIDWYTFGEKYTNLGYYFKTNDRKAEIQENEFANAIAIEYFGTMDIDERRVFELLERCFSFLPEPEYCVIKIKTDQSLQELLKYFTRLIPQLNCNNFDSYYLTHKNAILDELKVSFVHNSDLIAIHELLDLDVDTKEINLNVVMKLIINTLINPFSIERGVTVRSNGSMIGLILMKTAPRIDVLTKYYDFGSFADYDVLFDKNLHAEILYLWVHPLFESEARFIFSEISRLTGYNYFYYAITKTNPLIALNNLLPEMYPVLPLCFYRVFGENDFKNIDIPDGAFDDIDSIPFYFQSLKICQDPKINMDNRIISIGIDKTCLGFLKKLLFGKDYRKFKFTNVFVLQPVGQFEAEVSEIISEVNIGKIRGWRDYFGTKYIQKLGLPVWVNFINGALKRVERLKKVIVLKDNAALKYDTLLLLCSIEYGFPTELPIYLQKIAPANYAGVNNNLEAFLLFHKISMLKIAFPKGFDVIVYGNHMSTYTGINFLLEQGIKAKHIHFVLEEIKKMDEVNVGSFRDVQLADYMISVVKKLGINIYEGYRYREWEIQEDTNCIVYVLFESKTEIISLKCALFMNFNRKSIRREHFDIFQASGLVIDGRLVIDENFRLNDPYIYSAGSLAKYKRLLQASNLDHFFYCPYEVGETLCDKIMQNIISSNYLQHIRIKRELQSKIPIFTQPLYTQIVLPGNYLYIDIREPGNAIKYNLAQLFPSCGANFITGCYPNELNPENPKRTSVFCRVRLNDDGYMKRFICLTRNTNRSLEYLTKLFRYNQNMLNNMKERFEKGLITDFLEFFSQKWILPFLHNDFQNLIKLNHTTILNYLKLHYKKRNLQLVISSPHVLLPDEKIYLEHTLDHQTLAKALQKNLMVFLNNHSEHLFQYIHSNFNS